MTDCDIPIICNIRRGKYKVYHLNGNRIGHRECHIQSDWLLVYRYEDDVLVLTLARIGTHSDLFDLYIWLLKNRLSNPQRTKFR